MPIDKEKIANDHDSTVRHQIGCKNRTVRAFTRVKGQVKGSILVQPGHGVSFLAGHRKKVPHYNHLVVELAEHIKHIPINLPRFKTFIN